MRNIDRPWKQGIQAFACLCFLFASSVPGQERPPAGKVNTDFSRVYIFVDKAGPIGHQHAVEGKLASGELFQKEVKEGKLVFDMLPFNAYTPQAKKIWASINHCQFNIIFLQKTFSWVISATIYPREKTRARWQMWATSSKSVETTMTVNPVSRARAMRR